MHFGKGIARSEPLAVESLRIHGDTTVTLPC